MPNKCAVVGFAATFYDFYLVEAVLLSGFAKWTFAKHKIQSFEACAFAVGLLYRP